MFKEKIGMLTLMVGISMANSENVIVPVALIAVGMWLIRGLVNYGGKKDS